MKKRKGIMSRSDIPYAQRLAMERANDIKVCRDHCAQIAMFCMCVAMHEEEGIGYKRLVRFSLHFREILVEVYEDLEVGMAHLKHRMQQLGMPISGDFYSVKIEGASKRMQELRDHSMQAVQVALLCGAVTMNDEFGFGLERQTRINNKVKELTGRYNKEGQKFLLEKMQKIGFPIIDGRVMAFTDENGKPVMPSQAKNWKKE